MKLYTEEQAKYFFECGRNFQMNGEVTFSDAQKEITPIELPSDEEIDNQADFSFPYAERIGGETYSAFLGMKVGAKWMKEKILNQNKQHMNKETGNPIFKTTNDDIINSRIIYIKTQNADPIFRVSTEYDKLSTDEKIKMLDSLNNWVNGEKMSIQKAFSDGQETPLSHPTLTHYSREEYYNDNYNQ